MEFINPRRRDFSGDRRCQLPLRVGVGTPHSARTPAPLPGGSGERSGEPDEACRAFAQPIEGRRVGEPNESRRAERLPRRRHDVLGSQQAIGEIEGRRAGGRQKRVDVREEIERAARRDCGESRLPGKPGDEAIPADGILARACQTRVPAVR